MTKMPAPITAPMPSATRFHGPSTGRSAAASAPALAVRSMGFLTKSSMRAEHARTRRSGARVRDGLPLRRDENARPRDERGMFLTRARLPEYRRPNFWIHKDLNAWRDVEREAVQERVCL